MGFVVTIDFMVGMSTQASFSFVGMSSVLLCFSGLGSVVTITGVRVGVVAGV